MLHHLLLVGVEATVISKQEVSDDGLLQLCSSLQAPEVELSAVVSPVSDNSVLAVTKASVSKAEDAILNNVGARTPPRFTSFVTGKEPP